MTETEFIRHIEIPCKAWDGNAISKSNLGTEKEILTYTMKVIRAVSMMPC
jgi:hypothetical protein